MDKLKNVLNPGFKEQDELLYDTGNSKKSQDKDAETSGVNSGASISSDPKTAANTTPATTNPSTGDIGQPIDTTTSRTAVNQKEHMAPRDFAAASTTADDGRSQTQPSTQPASTGTAGATGLQTQAQNQPTTFGTAATTGPQTQAVNQPTTTSTAGATGAQPHDTTAHHHDHTARDTAVGAGAVGAAGAAAHHEHAKHHEARATEDTTDESKKEPNIIKKILHIGSSKKDDDGPTKLHKEPKEHKEHKDHHGGAAIFGSSSDKEKESEHKAKKEGGLLDKILHPGSKKHDEPSHETTTAAHSSRDQPGAHSASSEIPANASVGGGQTAAPIGAGAVGAVFATHEMKKHEREAQLEKTNPAGAHATSTQSVSTHPTGTQSVGTHPPSTQSASTQPPAAHDKTVAPFDLSSGHSVSRSTEPTAASSGLHSTGQTTHAPHTGAAGTGAASSSTEPIAASTSQYSSAPPSHSHHAGAIGTGAAVAAAGTAYAAHERHENPQTSSAPQNPETLTHHQHNTGNVLSHGQTAGHEHQHHHHDHRDAATAAATAAYEDRQHSERTSGHEQRDLHQHGADTGLSHHVHNGVTALPHHHSHETGKDTAAGSSHTHHHDTAAPAIAAGAAGTGIAAASVGHKEATPLQARTTNASRAANADDGPASKTKGPHDSNVMNILDPRVKPDVGAVQAQKEAQPTTSQLANADDGPASKTKGPHSSNILNILDPRVRPNVGAVQAGKDSQKSTETTQGSSTSGAPATHGTPVAGLTFGADPVVPKSSTSDTAKGTSTPSATATGDVPKSTATTSAVDTHKEHETPSSTSQKPNVPIAAGAGGAAGIAGASAASGHGAHKEHETPSSTSQQSSVPVAASSSGTVGNDYDAEHAGKDRAQEAALANKARDGEARPRVAVASNADAKSVGIDPQATADTIAKENSGAAGTHNEPAHTDNVKGIVTGETGNPFDSSDVYSRKPLDDRVNMPGSYPETASPAPKTG